MPYFTGYGAQNSYTLGTQFSVSLGCALLNIWWYSPPLATVLPQICGIWDISTQALITEDSAPVWLDPNGSIAVPGDGWVYTPFTAAGVMAVPGVNYAVAVWQANSGVPWWVTAANYWTPGSGLGGQNGISSGILTAPNTSASVHGQGCYDTSGTWEFPGTNPGNGEVFYVDVELSSPGVTPGAVIFRTGSVRSSATTTYPHG